MRVRTGLRGLVCRLGVLLVGSLVYPAAARAQVTAYALTPSWTQSKVLVNDAHTGAVIGSIPLTGEPYDVAVTPDGGGPTSRCAPIIVSRSSI